MFDGRLLVLFIPLVIINSQNILSELNALDPTHCMESFSFIRTKNNAYCYQITNVSYFDGNNVCPFHGYEFDMEVYKILGIDSYLPAQRGSRDQPFIWITARNYGKLVYADINVTLPFVPGNCLMFNNESQTIVPTLCNLSSKMICLYSAIYTDCPFPYDTCYFKKLGQQNRETYCGGSLAEPLNLHEGYFVSQYYSTEKCWLGLIKNSNGDLVWENSQLKLNYYNYLNNTDNGTYIYTYQGQWYSEKNPDALNCAICQTNDNSTQNNPKLTITWNNKTSSAILNVTNPKRILHGEISCDCIIKNQTFTYVKIYNVDELNNTNICEDYRKYYTYVICQGFDAYMKKYIQSNMVKFPDEYSEENGFEVYSITIKPFGLIDPFNFTMSQTYANLIETTCAMNCTCRPSKVTFLDDLEFLMVFEIYQLSLNVAEEYRWISDLKNRTETEYEIYDIRKVYFCMAEMTNFSGVYLTWPEAEKGSTVVPSECCQTPVTRTCLVDSDEGPVWSPINGNCTACTGEIQNLYNLLASFDILPTEKIIDKLKHMSERFNRSINYMQVHYSAMILDHISNDYENYTDFTLDNFFTVVDNLMSGNKTVLNISQYEMNTTDICLYSLENLLATHKNDISFDSSSIYLRKHSVTEFVIGWYLTPKLILTPIVLGTPIDNVLKKNPIVGAYIPEKAIEEIGATFLGKPFDLVFTFFANDHLFNGPEIHNVSQWIVGIEVPGFNKSLNNYIQVFMKKRGEVNYQACSHWRYGRDQKDYNIRGRWKIDYNMSVNSASEYLLCSFLHMTHFGMILNESILDDCVLNVITLIGFGTSVVGIIAIAITLIMYNKGTDKKNFVLIINYLISIIGMPVFLYISNAIKEGVSCKVIGGMLHYSIISQSVWTIILSYLQYRRYVVVFNSYKKSTIVTACFAGWSISSIPVVIVASISPDNYHKNSGDLCYLSEEYIKLAVVLPLILVLTANLIVFIKILYSLSKIKKSYYKDYYCSVFKLSNYLFFLFGFSWIFGVLVAFIHSTFLSHMFSVLTSIQGFVICIHFISTTKMKINRSREFISSTSSRNNVSRCIPEDDRSYAGKY